MLSSSKLDGLVNKSKKWDESSGLLLRSTHIAIYYSLWTNMCIFYDADSFLLLADIIYNGTVPSMPSSE